MADPDYFTIAEFRALPDMSDTDRYSDALVLLRAAEVTGIIEREVGTSFVARQVTDEPHNGGPVQPLPGAPGVIAYLPLVGSYSIVLDSDYVQTGQPVTATENGDAVTDDLVVTHGVLRRFSPGDRIYPLPWLPGTGNVLVSYVAGYSAQPPPDIKAAAMDGTRYRLLEKDSQAGIDARRTSTTTEMGTTTFVVAGEKRPTGYPDVDSVILGWARRLEIPSIP